MQERKWLPNPPKGTQICLGFDGSENDDYTAIKGETRSGRLFTPRYGPSRRPTIWNPAAFGGEIPRQEVHAAMDEIHSKWRVHRGYYDPYGWRTEIGEWINLYGADKVIEWPTYREKAMHEELQRFYTDMKPGRMEHDGCEITTLHMGNAQKVARNGQRYMLGKPGGEYHRKIDLAVTSVLAHAAACDSRTAGWIEEEVKESISHAMYGFN